MRKNSRNKGSRFERTIAKAWESWTGYKFSRTPGSGGWAKAKDAMGDLVCTDEKHSRRFPFSIECKTIRILSSNIYYWDLRAVKLYPFGNRLQRMLNVQEKYPYSSCGIILCQKVKLSLLWKLGK